MRLCDDPAVWKNSVFVFSRLVCNVCLDLDGAYCVCRFGAPDVANLDLL